MESKDSIIIDLDGNLLSVGNKNHYFWREVGERNRSLSTPAGFIPFCHVSNRRVETSHAVVIAIPEGHQIMTPSKILIHILI